MISLAIQADDDPKWRPDHFDYGAWGSHPSVKWPVVKLLDYVGREDYLAKSRNPFALVTLAMLKTLETKGDAESRLTWKMHLTEMVYARRWTPGELDELLQFVDNIMPLPKKLEHRYEAEVERIQAVKRTVAPIIRHFEEIADARGEARGERKTLISLLEHKFGPLPAAVTAKIEGASRGKLERLIATVLTANSLAEMPIFDQ